MTETELANEQIIASLRAELCELRALFTAQTERLGMAAALMGFQPDVPLATMRFEIGAKLGAVPALNQRTVEVVAKCLESFWRATKGETGILVEDQTGDSWVRFRAPAMEMLRALNEPSRG